MIDENLLRISPFNIDTGNKTLICNYFSVRIKNGKYENRICYCNESNFYIMKQKGFQKAFSLEINYFWSDLKKINCENSGIITLVFKEPVIIESDQHFDFLMIIIQHSRDILLDNEMPEVDLFSFNYSDLYHSRLSFYFRFRYLNLKKSIIVDRDTDSRIANFCEKKFGFIDVLELDPDCRYIPGLLESVAIEPKINTLIIKTYNGKTQWGYLSDFFKQNTTIEHLITYEQYDSYFDSFVCSIKNNDRSKLKRISFIKSAIGIKGIMMISELLYKGRIEILSLNNVLNGDLVPGFLTLVYQNHINWNLRVLNLDNTKGFDLCFLITASKRLHSISLCNCGFEIGKFFEILSTEKEVKISHLDISSNKTHQIIDDSFLLPVSLESLVVSNTIFREDSFFLLFRLANKSRITLDISRAILDQTKWKSFFERLKYFGSSNLNGLKWNENPLEFCFYSFLKDSVIFSLSLNGCCFNEPQDIENLGFFISSNSSIQSLSICGTDKHIIKTQYMVTLIGFLAINRTIRHLDLSNNHFGEDFFVEIQKLLMTNGVITSIVFPSFGLKEISYLNLFLKSMRSRGIPLTFNFPENELSYYKHKNLISNNEIIEMQSLYSLVQKLNSNLQVFMDINSSSLSVTSNQFLLSKFGDSLLINENSFSEKSKPIGYDWEILFPKIPCFKYCSRYKCICNDYNIINILEKIKNV